MVSRAPFIPPINLSVAKSSGMKVSAKMMQATTTVIIIIALMSGYELFLRDRCCGRPFPPNHPRATDDGVGSDHCLST